MLMRIHVYKYRRAWRVMFPAMSIDTPTWREAMDHACVVLWQGVRA